MENKIKKCLFSILTFFSVGIVISCGRNEKVSSPDFVPALNTQSERAAEEKKKSVPVNGAIVFIDKSASLQNVASEEATKVGKQIFEKLQDFLGTFGGEVTFYFIHKDLVSASPFYTMDCAMLDTKDMTAFPAAAAKRKYNLKVDSLIYHINDAIRTPISQPTSHETDLWITLKKAEDKFANLPQNGKRLLIYYSDMVESVNNSTCGKDYEHTKFKNVPEAIALGKKDAMPIKNCTTITKFSGSTEVFICFPVGAMETSKHPYMFDYWKALFSEFEADKVGSNL